MKIAVKAILFDLDGTLVNSAPEIVAAANQTLAALNLPQLLHQQIEPYIGEGRAHLIEGFLGASLGKQPDEVLLEQANHEFAKQFNKTQNSSHLFNGTVEGLILLQTMGFRLGCVTNKPSVAARDFMHERGLSEYFEIVMCGDSLTKRKPEADQILYICHQLGLLPHQVLMVGDSKTDVMAARAAGCYVFSVPYGYNRDAGLHDTDGHVASMLDIADLVELA